MSSVLPMMISQSVLLLLPTMVMVQGQ